ncbi:flagellar export chaperone FliS [Pelagicoccus mobilis]|uniref:Flagellar secretion chaperone FliS n=1 Tax=Pelagicoccus mobilis TaxID=415221 RepID=A0A934RZB9_9BACT|nr:flagellar export chaperone FliS [Pelagicoccus mobilis]MBK1880465.1 flagellar export chaperone FliS [Pelagicoccus mobilis]
MKSNAASYKRAAIMSASPERLILMLYDGALAAMKRAKEGFTITNNIKMRNETISNNLIKAQNIFAELQRSLKIEKDDDFADRMFNLYDFYNVKLNEANFKKIEEPIDTVIRLFQEIRDAWAEAMAKQQPAATMPAPANLNAGIGGGISLRA